MTTYLRLLYPQLLPDLLHSNATGNVCQNLARREAYGLPSYHAPVSRRRSLPLSSQAPRLAPAFIPLAYYPCARRSHLQCRLAKVNGLWIFYFA